MEARQRKKSGPKPVGLADAPQVPAVVQALDEASRPFLSLFADRRAGERLTGDQKRALIELIAIYGGDMGKVANRTGVDKTVLFDIKHGNIEEYANRRLQWKKAMAMEAAEVATVAAAQIRDRLPEASARDAAVVYGIMVEKSALLAGETVGAVGPGGRGVTVNIVGDSAIAQLQGRASDLMGRIVDGVAEAVEPFDSAESANLTESRAGGSVRIDTNG